MYFVSNTRVAFKHRLSRFIVVQYNLSFSCAMFVFVIFRRYVEHMSTLSW